MIDLEQLEVFSGHMTASEAYLYVRMPDLGGGGSWSLVGALEGPACRHAATLPLKVPVLDLGAGPTLLARAIVPDPSFWSPEMPSLYRLSLELRDHGETTQTTELDYGFRLLGASRQNLILENRRWVMRGVTTTEPVTPSLEQWRDAATCLVVTDPSPELCLEADRAGVFLVVRLDEARGGALAGRVRHFAQHPAIVAAILPESTEADKTLRAASGNMLLAQSFSAGSPCRPDDWADVVVCEVERLGQFAADIDECRLPIIVQRAQAGFAGFNETRLACDHLQRDLARFGDFAGYLIRPLPPSDNGPSASAGDDT